MDSPGDSPACILVVDDEPDIRTLLREFLTFRGYKVGLAASGKEAFERLVEHDWDLVISDFRLGDLTGFDVLREARRRHPTSEVIILTGYGSVAQTITAADLGASAYLQKPVILNELEVRVEEALAKRRFGLRTQRLVEDSLSVDGDCVRDHIKKMADLYAFTRSLLSSIEYQDVIQQVLLGVTKLFSPRNCFVYVAKDGEGALYGHAEEPMRASQARRALDRILDYWRQFESDAPSSDEVTISPPVVQDAEPASGVREADLICTPLGVQNRLTGVLAVSDLPNSVGGEDLKSLMAIVSGQAASAIERASRHHHAKMLSLTDGLTRLLNRRALNDRLQQEFDRARRYGSCLSMIMLDIDHFKEVNDHYGHQQGDTVLRELADRLVECSRRSDILARYGGEEFILVLPETPLANAAQLAERLRLRVASSRFRLDCGPIPVTISLGVASFPHHGVSDETTLIAAADRELYRAKHEGRNRVCTVIEEGPES